MSAVIELKGVTKMYGSSRGVRDVSLRVEAGSIFGFLGPNGAGKTTTISLLIDLIRPTKGSIQLFGLDSQRDSLAIRRRIGFLAGDFALDESLTGWQQLTYFGNLRGGVSQARIRELAKQFDCNLNRSIKTLSRGNRQKIGLISALMHEPELLIFDEPTSGLDPIMQAAFNTTIRDYRQAGKTVFISSHLLSEVQEVCDRVAFIREGNLLAVRDLREITASSPKHVHLITGDQKLLSQLKKLKGLHILTNESPVLEATYQGDINTLLELLGRFKLDDLTITEADLETTFMQYYEAKHV